ncbi:MAG: Trm112 family protein, partial [Anaerolineae bacterium]
MVEHCPKCGGELKLKELSTRRRRGRRDFDYEVPELQRVLICSQCGRTFPISEPEHPTDN